MEVYIQSQISSCNVYSKHQHLSRIPRAVVGPSNNAVEGKKFSYTRYTAELKKLPFTVRVKNKRNTSHVVSFIDNQCREYL